MSPNDTGIRSIILRILTIGAAIPPSVRGAYTLITFDVDGTLVKGSGRAADASAHARSFGVACGKIFGPDGNPTRPIADAIPRRDYHGSTDGLILLRLARAELGIEPVESASKLDDMMDVMYDYINELDDEEIARGIKPLPGVIDNLKTLATMKDRVCCGLVTGNVEGIARRKMKAVGIWQTGALSPPARDQIGISIAGTGSPSGSRWTGTDDISFLGGFGSDYCSGNIDDVSRNYLDRSEQIAIATRRCRQSLMDSPETKEQLKRVVHVGDAPADVLAAKAFAERMEDDRRGDDDESVCIGCVAVATGSYGVDELKELAGETRPGRWEPVVLKEGMADPNFLKACGL